MAGSATHLEVKVFVDKVKRRVLFAEAGGDFVDVLFSFFTLPLGTIVRLIGKTQSEPSTLGCFTTLYQSVMNLGNQYFFCDGLKDMLLRPRSSNEELCRRLKINIDDTKAKYFVCEYECKKDGLIYMSIYRDALCPRCSHHNYMAKEVKLPNDSSKGQVFVTKALEFIITDDLQVTPVLLNTVIGHLNNLGIKDMSVVEERTLKLGINEVMELLKLTLLSKTPLTDLLFAKKKQPGGSVPKNLSMLKTSHCADDDFGEDRKINVKMVVNKSSKEFLYYEGGKEFIDFLFSLLLIPLGEMLHIMEGQSFLGSIDGLYKSVQSLDSQYFFFSHKDILLRPKLPVLSRYNHLFPLEVASFVNGCWFVMPSRVDFDGSGGFVKENKLFVVLDNLVVRPASPASAISIMIRKELAVSDLEEMKVSLGMAEGISILRASLNSTCAISNGLPQNDRVLKEPKQEK